MRMTEEEIQRRNNGLLGLAERLLPPEMHDELRKVRDFRDAASKLPDGERATAAIGAWFATMNHLPPLMAGLADLADPAGANHLQSARAVILMADWINSLQDYLYNICERTGTPTDLLQLPSRVDRDTYFRELQKPHRPYGRAKAMVETYDQSKKDAAGTDPSTFA